ncbi:MAG: hypothetical protein J1E77_08965 [Prevotella sp.]|nr:hypothetical protein [Prevotella sp.]
MKRLILVAMWVWAWAVADGQTDEFRKSYDEFRRQARAEYEDFRQKANREYAEWMRQAWEWHQRIEPVERPKDEMLPPVIYDREQRNEPKPIDYDEVVPTPAPQPQPKPVAPIRENDGEWQTATFQFFGTAGRVRLPKGFAFRLGGMDEKAFAAGWEELSAAQYDNLIRDCLALRMEHQLCDWAYLMMLGAMSEAVCGKGSNEARMMQGYALCQSGYKVRFGLAEDRRLRLLFKSEHQIFGMAAYKLQDGLFYLTEPADDRGMRICDIAYPEERPLSLWITQEQRLAERNSAERLLAPADSLTSIKVQVNENLLEFYDSYPTSMVGDDVLSRWAMYATTPLAGKVREQLYPQLRAAMGREASAEAAAGWLLNWVQTAFVYEYDDKVWGHDRAFFAEETLRYPYCDCEDRAILYSRLVRDLLGLDVLLVFYPGHLAAAVEFKTAVEGDYIVLGGRRFTVCDPTYIGAPIGATMPGMDNKTAKVTLLMAAKKQ